MINLSGIKFTKKQQEDFLKGDSELNYKTKKEVIARFSKYYQEILDEPHPQGTDYIKFDQELSFLSKKIY